MEKKDRFQLNKRIVSVMIVAVFCITAVFCSGCSSKPAEAARVTEEPSQEESENTCKQIEDDGITTIVCFGDSNTYGYDPVNGGRYPKEVIWPYVLAEKLGAGYRVVNEGRNGRTTAYDKPGTTGRNGLTYLDEMLKEHCLEGEDYFDMIIFMLGTNDIFMGTLTTDEITEGMEQLILSVKELGAVKCGWNPQIVIVTPRFVDSDLMERAQGVRVDREQEMSVELVSKYKELAEKYDCLFLDTFGKIELSEADGMHFTESGHEQMATMVYDLIINN